MKALERIMKRYTYSTANGTEVDVEEAESSAKDSNAERPCESKTEPAPETQSKGWFTMSKTGDTARDGSGDKPRSAAQREIVKKSKRIAVQGLLYVGAFYITWLFPTISRITELAVGKNYFPIQFLDTFLIPLQGFINFLIYIRPHYLKYRGRGKTVLESFKTASFEIRID